MNDPQPPASTGQPQTTHAKFKVTREFLGLTEDWLAEHLKVPASTVRKWETGESLIPGDVGLEVLDLERLTREFVSKAVSELAGLREPGIVTFREDAEYHAAHPETGWPASWHRAVCARIALEVPGLVIAYESDVKADDVTVAAQ